MYSTGSNPYKRKAPQAAFANTTSESEIPGTHYMIRDLLHSGAKFCCALAVYGRLLGLEAIDAVTMNTVTYGN